MEGWEEVCSCVSLVWNLDGAGLLLALGVEGRRGVDLWVYLRKKCSYYMHKA